MSFFIDPISGATYISDVVFHWSNQRCYIHLWCCFFQRCYIHLWCRFFQRCYIHLWFRFSLVRPSPPLNIYFPIPYLIYFIIENVVTITRTSTFQFFMVLWSSALHLTRKYPTYPEIPENTRYTRHTRKYPRVKKDTRKYPIVYFDTPTRPDPTRYPVFCPIPDPTRPDIEKPYPLGTAHKHGDLKDFSWILYLRCF